eukprot:9486335-Pyramimonas_sp.AAC.1
MGSERRELLIRSNGLWRLRLRTAWDPKGGAVRRIPDPGSIGYRMGSRYTRVFFGLAVRCRPGFNRVSNGL